MTTHNTLKTRGLRHFLILAFGLLFVLTSQKKADAFIGLTVPTQYQVEAKGGADINKDRFSGEVQVSGSIFALFGASGSIGMGQMQDSKGLDIYANLMLRTGSPTRIGFFLLEPHFSFGLYMSSLQIQDITTGALHHYISGVAQLGLDIGLPYKWKGKSAKQIVISVNYRYIIGQVSIPSPHIIMFGVGYKFTNGFWNPPAQ
mgnify:CR=1 FL=1